MRHDIQLARRIRGDDQRDRRDFLPKNGKENFESLPYFSSAMNHTETTHLESTL